MILSFIQSYVIQNEDFDHDLDNLEDDDFPLYNATDSQIDQKDNIQNEEKVENYEGVEHIENIENVAETNDENIHEDSELASEYRLHLH